MGIIVVWAWMLWELGAADHGCYCGFGTAALEADAVDNRRYCGVGMDALATERSRPKNMDALGIGYCQPWALLWIGHGCFVPSTMDATITVWACVLCDLGAVDQGRYYGLGMYALGILGIEQRVLRYVRAMMEVFL